MPNVTVLARASIALGLVAAGAACDWTRPLDEDPRAWAPPATARVTATAEDVTDAAPPLPEECTTETPAYDPTLTTSTSTATSHRPSEPCLEGCHEPGGAARLAFAAAGTVHVARGIRIPVATGGSVHAVGGSTLAVDRCGNFYATALASSPQSTQPFVAQPTLRRMEKTLYREASAGSCNHTGCHDFTEASKPGVYF